MKLAFQLAYENLIGAGLRTLLTVGVLSFAFVIIILINGFVTGWKEQATRDLINWEIGSGHLENKNYDPYDPFTITDGHGVLDGNQYQDLSPILIRQAAIFPSGRMVSVLLKGISTSQTVLKLPTKLLLESSAEIPAIIGKRMAESAHLKVGDEVLMRWRDKNGIFDAAPVTIVGIFSCNVPSVDQGQIWISIQKLWQMTGLKNNATFFIAGENFKEKALPNWNFKSQYLLLADMRKILNSERIGDAFIYILLLAIALLAIFDTQVLSVFRRQREIGTFISLGMTRAQVVTLFTIEGSMNSILAVLVGTAYSTPFFIYLTYTGISIPVSSDEMGVTLPSTIYPAFSADLILGTIALVVISSTIVSLLPSRKIATMNRVDALKGKIQ
ncbi:MAG: ABC transporter permease [Bacteroidetes bacterium]|nr:ABC transporter permease [Bacteroidota bacterium]